MRGIHTLLFPKFAIRGLATSTRAMRTAHQLPKHPGPSSKTSVVNDVPPLLESVLIVMNDMIVESVISVRSDLQKCFAENLKLTVCKKLNCFLRGIEITEKMTICGR